MEFYREIAAHRVCGPETLGSYGLSNVWATGRAILIPLKKASRPHTFDPRQVFRVINPIFYHKHHHKKHGNEKLERRGYLFELKALFQIINVNSFGPLPILWWTQRRDNLSKVLSRINWNSGWMNGLKYIR